MTFPFDERNRNDYVAMSDRLRTSLARIEQERTESGAYRHAASAKTLAKLAACSVATIYARQGSSPFDPIAALRAIKDARLDEERRNRTTRSSKLRITKEHLQEVDEHIQANARLRADVCRALDEATRWHHLHTELTLKHSALVATNSRLIEKVALLERRIADLTRQMEQVHSGIAVKKQPREKVTPIGRK